MSLWHAHSRPRTQDSGKFHRRRAIGVSHSDAGQHLGWHYEVIVHLTGSSVRRSSYNVTIRDSHQAHVAYLRGFSTAEQAVTAAKTLIQRSQQRRLLPSNATDIGTIPSLPRS